MARRRDDDVCKQETVHTRPPCDKPRAAPPSADHGLTQPVPDRPRALPTATGGPGAAGGGHTRLGHRWSLPGQQSSPGPSPRPPSTAAWRKPSGAAVTGGKSVPSQQLAPGLGQLDAPDLQRLNPNLNLTFPHALRGAECRAQGGAGHVGAPPPLGVAMWGCCCFSGDTPLCTDYRRWDAGGTGSWAGAARVLRGQ